MASEMDYLFVLEALRDIPFGVGKKLLITYLQGKTTHESILKNNLDRFDSFGSLSYSNDEIDKIINNLILNNLIKQVAIKGNRFWKVMELSNEGYKELSKPELYKKKVSYNLKIKKTVITDNDKLIFSAFGPFLAKYNDEQKKAIICNTKKVLCIAGAGSGKTTVLTKKIEYLVNYQSINPTKILAITFTKKAKQEMQYRLKNFSDVKIETFNSFCEKILLKNNDVFYDTQVRMISYRDKIQMINKALTKLGTTIGSAINCYFSVGQQRGKTQEQLANIFMNDCFFIRDYLKFKNLSSDDFDTSDLAAKLVFDVGNYIEQYMSKNGLRDFSDQLMDTLKLFKDHPDLIPLYDYILIDEYQDINSSQIELIDLLKSDFLFCVGDPRQSIFGWRGSSIKHILDFEKKYPDCEIISLVKNYRSNKYIVDLINESIKDMGLANLESTINGKKDVHLLNFGSEISEFDFVAQKIIASKLPRSEIFVLARTNRQLSDLSARFNQLGIKHVIKSDELNRSVIGKTEDVTLATIHAIKGLEAQKVFIIGCTYLNFPCRGSEHPVIDMVKVNDYDKEEEEKRLFYVAMSRAKNHLFLTYTGKKHTTFITKEMINLISKTKLNLEPSPQLKSNVKGNNLLNSLKEWRRNISSQLNMPAFMVMHDKTLVELSLNRPTTKQELESINGMGPTKIMKYGDQLLDLINFS